MSRARGYGQLLKTVELALEGKAVLWLTHDVSNAESQIKQVLESHGAMATLMPVTVPGKLEFFSGGRITIKSEARGGRA